VLSTKEKRFIKFWEEQRTGGRWAYYPLYIIAGSVICIIVVSFLVMLTTIGGMDYFKPIVIGSVALVTALTIGSWEYNEKRFKAIIRREVNAGKLQDDKATDEKLV
jgi:peptidoglycan/LPS O-acetylase OafA/YrhL